MEREWSPSFTVFTHKDVQWQEQRNRKRASFFQHSFYFWLVFIAFFFFCWDRASSLAFLWFPLTIFIIRRCIASLLSLSTVPNHGSCWASNMPDNHATDTNLMSRPGISDRLRFQGWRFQGRLANTVPLHDKTALDFSFMALPAYAHIFFTPSLILTLALNSCSYGDLMVGCLIPLLSSMHIRAPLSRIP